MTRARLLPRSAQGFTLLEVLIAVVVLSVGLLGLAGLQTAGLRQNHSAFMRSQATMLAYDIIDRMRTNKGTVDVGGYDILMTDFPPTPPPMSPTPDCITLACTGAQLAARERFDWIQRIAAALPAGDGAVTCGPAGVPLCAAGLVVTVTVAWDDNRSGVIDPNENFVMSTQL